MSIYEKLNRLHIPVSVEGIEKNLNDIAGVRVICSFVDDIYKLADMLAVQDDVYVVQTKDYIKNPKPSGYRSLHMIVEVPIFLSKEKRYMRVEVQLRTIAMDWRSASRLKPRALKRVWNKNRMKGTASAHAGHKEQRRCPNFCGML